MGKILFAVSDIHGHYTALMNALGVAGFDENNENHIFVSCGDLFDRGRENAEVYDFVKKLQRKILIKGNHEDGLVRILKRPFPCPQIPLTPSCTFDKESPADNSGAA